MAKKKARPEMYWDERKQLWRKRIKIDGAWSEVSGKTQDEVREKKREVERQQKAGLRISDQTLFGEYAQEWYKVKAAGIKAKSANVYKVAFNNHLSPALGTIPIKSIRPLHIQKLMAGCAHLSRSSQSKILFTASQVFESAIENGLIEKNPTHGIKAGGSAAKEKRPLTDAQQRELLNAVRETRAELFVMLCLLAGLRKEEALGLTWGSVCLDETPYIEVTHTVTHDGNRPVHTPDLKSAAANRCIPIPPELSNRLKVERVNAKGICVVPSARTGQAMSTSAFKKMWAIVNVDFHVTPHLLRHTYISNLCAKGIDIKKIQYLAGHEDVTLTLNIYTHVTENTPKELARILQIGEKKRVSKYRLVEKPVGR